MLIYKFVNYLQVRKIDNLYIWLLTYETIRVTKKKHLQWFRISATILAINLWNTFGNKIFLCFVKQCKFIILIYIIEWKQRMCSTSLMSYRGIRIRQRNSKTMLRNCFPLPSHNLFNLHYGVFEPHQTVCKLKRSIPTSTAT